MPDNTPYCQKPENLKSVPQDCSPEQIGACHGSDGPHPCELPSDELILRSFEQKEGFLPKPLVLMSKRPGMLPKFVAYARALFEGGPLSDRERFLVALAASTALKSEDCMQAQSRRAARAGATSDEILQTTLIAGLIANTSTLHLVQGSVDALSGRDDAK